MLAGATLITKRIRGIRRAAMAPVIPTTGGKAVLIDCGANAECTPEYLMQFAYLGSFYAGRVLGLERPRVGLLNIGAEDSKGTDLQKQTLALLRKAGEEGHLNFIGNIEPRRPSRAAATSSSPTASPATSCSRLWRRGLLCRSRPGGHFPEEPADQAGRRHGDAGAAGLQGPAGPQQGGGTAFIGISKPVIKAHGSSNAEAIDNAIGQARQVAESGIIGQIQENVHLMQLQAE